MFVDGICITENIMNNEDMIKYILNNSFICDILAKFYKFFFVSI